MHDNPEQHRYEIVDGDELAGFVEYERSPGVIALTHTETLPAFAGRGFARRLVLEVLAEARAQGLFVLPFCPYVRKIIAENEADHLDLVPAERRAQFGLRTSTDRGR